MVIINCKFLIKKGYSADILDAEAENLTHEKTAEKIAKKI